MEVRMRRRLTEVGGRKIRVASASSLRELV